MKSWSLLLIIATIATGFVGCDDDGNDRREFPNRPIKLIVPFNAGGSSNTFARVIQQAIADHDLLPVPVVIINRGGAGGTIGSRYVKHRRPDGYTIMLLHDAVLTARYAGKVEYGPEAFDAIAGTGADSEVIVVSEESPFESLTELLTKAKQSPNEIKIAVNFGAPSEFTARRLQAKSEGAVFRYVQSGGGAERFASLVGGHVDVSIFSVGEYLQIQSAGLKALAVFDDERNPAIPDVPTARESGIGVVSSHIQYWWAPKGTPPERIEVIADALRKAMATKQVREALAATQTKPTVLSSKQVRERLDRVEAELSVTVSTAPENLRWLPHAVFAVCIGLAALLLIRRHLQRTPHAWQGSGQRALANYFRANAVPLIFLVLVLLYTLAFQSEAIDFRFATFAFIAAASATMTGPKLKSLVPIATLALAFSLGTYYLMAQLLGVDLP